MTTVTPIPPNKWRKRTAIGATALGGVLAIFTLPKLFEALDAPPQIFANGYEEAAKVDICDHRLVMPDGFVGTYQSWETTFTSKQKPVRNPPSPPVMHFPNTPGFPVGVGAGRDQFLSVPFTPPAGATAGFFFDMHQARPQEGEPMGRPSILMTITISPCVGDFRPNGWCSVTANTGSLVWSTLPVPEGKPACQLEAGKEYHLLAAPVDPTDGIVHGDYYCSDPNAAYCWVQMAHRPTVWPQ